MVYDQAQRSQLTEEEPEIGMQLVALFGLHVDDILGCCQHDHPRWTKFQTELKGIFTFRTWEEAGEDHALEYCGAKIHVEHKLISLE